MPPEVTCPACQRRSSVTCGAVCPRCGAGLLATVRCPSCHKEVAGLCLICPHCDEPLAERHRFRRTDDPEGARGTTALVALVAVGAGIVVAWSLLALARAMEKGGDTADGAVVLGVAIVAAAAVVFGVFLPTRFRSPYEERATVGGTFLAETVGPLGCFSLVALAVLTFIFFVCAGG
jgi:hypothetical protein